MSSLPTIPDPASARLPVTYEAAQKALTECQRVDEVKDWADKAAALSAYARMAKNDNLRLMALRIQERATRRMGELLKQLPRGDEATRYGQDGSVPPVTRTQAAADAGLSERQRKTALRVANIPEDQFEAAVESASPPTLSAMARWGTNPRTDAGATPADIQLAREARNLLRNFAAFCGLYDPARIAFAMRDPGGCRGNVEAIDAWLDRFVTNLGSENEAA
jgi:hypothetical protein